MEGGAGATELQVPEPDVSIAGLIESGWAKVKGRKSMYMAAFGISFLVQVTVVILSMIVIFAVKDTFLLSVLNTGFGLFQSVVSYGMTAGLFMIGVHIARGKNVKATEIFAYFDRIVPLIIQYILMSILLMIGFILLILPGIYLMVSYMFAVPLLLDKGLGPWQAMEHSRQVVSGRWFSYFGTILVTMALVGLSAIPLGIGLIWTLPLAYNVYGEMYVAAFDRESGKGAIE